MQDSKTVIATGSKSFYFASLFFTKKNKLDCWILYRWCRYCDDQIDQAVNQEAAKDVLQLLTTNTEQAYIVPGKDDQSLFTEVAAVFRQHQIPFEYPQSLLAGFAMDVENRRYQSLQDLELYAYRVAGVVGLMMTRILGVKSTAANHHAIAMGNAMQLTNIARDVAEDFNRGRIYLPEQWIYETRIMPEWILSDQNKEDTYKIVLRLLDRADELYSEGRKGLKYLPLRARLAVSIASHIYQHIGTKIRKKGPGALSSRTVVTATEKICLAVRGVFAL
ncbi:phytoene/squalene synthase family protein [Bdellovibrio reynosensis]|uniref:Phytoene/squalene synthase family protein n=1 Tax=Bdellovibrio reynosensis TaxID=2835041 RepID=A0ABY4C5A6_9BACT|nr:phytoene/squalene synthase family protein [Bdellovibrio reynosensis]UOF00048.1 phytoene/squalene synthase family protein [Bdellovibrio reynosensis]